MKTENDQITLAQFIAEHGITMTARRTALNRNMEGSEKMDNWLCTLRLRANKMTGKATMRVPFSMGTGNRKQPSEPMTYEQWLRINDPNPTPRTPASEANLRGNYRAYLERRAEPVKPDAADVLSCLASDAATGDQDFTQWCNDLGYDYDSRKAFRTYRIVKRQTAKLRAFLGAAAFEQILYGTEPL